jgi:hypothetical protein
MTTDFTTMTLKALKEQAKSLGHETGYEISKCRRCGGQGGWEGWPGFTCFECNGAGKSEYPVYDDAELELKGDIMCEINRRKEVAKEKKAEKVRAAMMAAIPQPQLAQFMEMAKLGRARFEELVKQANDKCASGLLNDEDYENWVDTRMGWALKVAHEFSIRINAGKELSERQVALIERLWESHQQGLERKAQREESNAASEYVGEIKQRLDLELTIESTINLPDYGYGSSTIFIMRDADCNVFTWKTGVWVTVTDEGERYQRSAQRGDVLKIKGTVKEHSEYQGTKQTVLTRCKVAP